MLLEVTTLILLKASGFINVKKIDPSLSILETGGAFRIYWPNSNTFISIWNYSFVIFWTVTLLVGVQNDRHGSFDVIFDLTMKLSTMCVCVHEQGYIYDKLETAHQ